MHKLALVALLGILLSQIATAQSSNTNDFKFPGQLGYVNDFEGIFDKTQINELDKLIVEYNDKSSNEIIVVTTKSYKPYKILNDYSEALATTWEKENGNNQIFIVFGRKIRKIEIEVGSGLDSKLTENKVEDIIKNDIISEFRKRNTYKGVKDGVVAIINELEAE